MPKTATTAGKKTTKTTSKRLTRWIKDGLAPQEVDQRWPKVTYLRLQATNYRHLATAITVSCQPHEVEKITKTATQD